MLDWMFILFIILAIFFIILAITIDTSEPFWKLMFITLSTVLWFILALNMFNIQTPYTNYNETTGQTEMLYKQYYNESDIYLSYFFALMGILTMLYLIILIFDTYYTFKEEEG